MGDFDLQIFYRKIGDSLTTINSFTEDLSMSCVSRQISAKTDEELEDLENQFKCGSISMKDFDESSKTKFFNDIFTQRQNKKFSDIMSNYDKIMSSRKDYTLVELLEKKKTPLVYTQKELSLLLTLPTSEYIKWFRNEIICILKYIDRFKKASIKYKFQTKNDEIFRRPCIVDSMNEVELEKELECLYQRVLLIYMMNFSTEKCHTSFKKKLFTETNFLKQLMYSITEEMDNKFMRIKNYVSNIEYINDTKNFPIISLENIIEVVDRAYEHHVIGFNFYYSHNQILLNPSLIYCSLSTTVRTVLNLRNLFNAIDQ
uniref:DUF4806 domain-containing protein n=1 Tax=Parastrongyloides trichosuri TaxID=131310 RepID=A0A0N4Z074_PARTI